MDNELKEQEGLISSECPPEYAAEEQCELWFKEFSWYIEILDEEQMQI